MTRKLTLKTAKALVALKDGERLPYGGFKKNALINELINENILLKTGKHSRYKVNLTNAQALDTYLYNQCQIQDLAQLIDLLESDNPQRADFTALTGNSKFGSTRVFKGFLVNSYQPIPAELNGEKFIVSPTDGIFQFIYDYKDFIPDKSVTIVGLENAENFRYIQEQKYLFADFKDFQPLFVSRYPPKQHKDVIRWLSVLPNRYLHFGDFDLAGIAIYLNEYKKHLGDRASFFIPPSIAQDLSQFGNRDRYENQRNNMNIDVVDETELRALINLIHREQKGLDQEFYIQRVN